MNPPLPPPSNATSLRSWCLGICWSVASTAAALTAMANLLSLIRVVVLSSSMLVSAWHDPVGVPRRFGPSISWSVVGLTLGILLPRVSWRRFSALWRSVPAAVQGRHPIKGSSAIVGILLAVAVLIGAGISTFIGIKRGGVGPPAAGALRNPGTASAPDASR